MKKIISMLVVLTMVISVCVMSVSASPPWLKGEKDIPPGLQKNGKLPYGIAKKVFEDADEFKWAQKAIEKLYKKGLVKGYGNRYYKPSDQVTKLETVIMTLRIMGWEEKAFDAKVLTKKYSGKEVGDWAVGYINIAYEKGILNDVDMMYFEPAQPAQRHEVAKYVLRALGYEEDAQAKMNEELPFADASLVPVGSIGYVYLIDELELMQGYGGKFNPLGTLTRAEMAVLFERLDNKVDSDVDESEFKGKIIGINDGIIDVKVKGEVDSYELSEEVIVYADDERISFEDIEVGLQVKLQLDNNLVVYIEVIDEDEEDDKIISVYSGTITSISDEGKEIAIKDKELKLVFTVIDDVEVSLNDETVDFDELAIGDNAKIVVDNENRAREIKIIREEEQVPEVIQGYITSIDLAGIYHISVSEDVYRSTQYKMAENAQVIIDNEEADLSDLVIGMYADVTLTEEVVTKVVSENVELEYTAEIASITDNFITIILEDDTEATFMLAKDVYVSIGDDTESSIEDLNDGDKGNFEIVNNNVVEIEITTAQE